jgi:Methyltransferase domain
MSDVTSRSSRTTRLNSFDEFAAWSAVSQDLLAYRAQREIQLQGGRQMFCVPGLCAVCQTDSVFLVDMQYAHVMPDGSRIPNWRERLECWHCRLNNRMRGALHFLRDELGARRDSRIYVSEQLTPMYTALKNRYEHVMGSEFLGMNLPSGTVKNGVRHEDITRLSFGTGSFDYILSFDVLEHVPDYNAGIREMARALRSGGWLLATVPFSLGSPETIVRAVVENGQIRHIMEPEYHGDPVTGQVLCYYHFGWRLLDELRAAGFAEAAMHFYWSDLQGYLGGMQFLIAARKA